MQEKFGKQGLATLAVHVGSLDEGKKLPALVAKELAAKKVTAPSLILNEPDEVWQKKFGITEYPCIFVFTKDGKWTKYNGKFDYPDIDKLVEKLLKK
jgi:hypothetical protein